MAKTITISAPIQPVGPSAVAASLGISRATLYRRLKRRVIPQPNIKIERTKRWSIAVIHKFIQDGVVAP